MFEDYGLSYFESKPTVKFYKNEIIDLMISTIVLVLLLIFRDLNYVVSYPWLILAYFLIAITGFVCHEIGHKVMAMLRGYIAYYSIYPQFLLMSLLFSIATFGQVLFLAFGAVNIIPTIFSKMDYRDMRDIAMAGPLVNIFFAIFFVALLKSFFFPPVIAYILYWTAKVNLYLALFNLLPFPPLDGAKIFVADTLTYFILFGFTLLLFFLI